VFLGFGSGTLIPTADTPMTDYISFAAVALAFLYSQRRKQSTIIHHLELDESEQLQLNILESRWNYSTEVEKLVRWIPKVELHVHFDGSWDPTMIYQHLLENGNVELLPHVSILPWDQSEYPVRQLVQQCSDQVEFHSLCTCRGKQSLYEMIKAFEIFLPLVRGNLPLLEDLAVDFCKRQAQQHVVYTEMRYSPHLLATGGSLEYKENAAMVNADVVVDAITRGLRRGQELYHVAVNQILCCITWRPDWANDVVRLAQERRKDTPCAVVGVDIAAGEEHFDKANNPHLYRAHFQAMKKAKSLGIPITLHAGEVSVGDLYVKTAIDDFGACRIGHGYRMSHAMMQYCKERKIHVEVCPTSSVETGGWKYNVKNWKEHPAVRMVREHVSVSLNSDDPSVFDTSLTWQWRIALGKMGLTIEECKRSTRDAIDAAFISEAEKKRLHGLVEDHVPHQRPWLIETHSFCDRVSGVNQVKMEEC
jgi:adenosine deaminase